ncbi:DUF2591 domain-containing protein [Salmonella enterica subsp. salamae]|nr:DUF2591 domain-containing protein [Salmonella enterica subsp. salamae]ECF6093102.1 DUF2591 domain-containing protein [Salmonella enterica subsp. salamae]EDW5992474.1 DUF2591 domain-containing protein [Salmonella enterica subsp. salamae]
MKRIMKICELTGSALDYAVDRAVNGAKYSEQLSVIRASGDGFRPSSSWRVCGPLLERYRIDLITDPESDTWWADKADGTEIGYLYGSGSSPLVAICRALASISGDEIAIPEEILQKSGCMEVPCTR